MRLSDDADAFRATVWAAVVADNENVDNASLSCETGWYGAYKRRL